MVSLCLVVASGSLGVARDAMFLVTGHTPSDPESAFWAYVRICFVVAAVSAWLIEHKKVRDLENPYEREDSLRRRTMAIAEEIEIFTRERLQLARSIVGTDQDPIEPKQRRHQQESQDLFIVRFSQKLKGVTQELDAKGVNTEWFPGTGMSIGDINRPFDGREIATLRSLAFRVDRNDEQIRF